MRTVERIGRFWKRALTDTDWDTAITEIAARLGHPRWRHDLLLRRRWPRNHLGGAYAPATMRAFGARYRSSALAQETTGEFWVSARMLGHITRADFAVFVGKNPYQSHGFPRAVGSEGDREGPGSPTSTSKVRPGTDVYLLTALAAVLVRENLVATDWLAQHADGFDEVAAVLRAVSISDYAPVPVWQKNKRGPRHGGSPPPSRSPCSRTSGSR